MVLQWHPVRRHVLLHQVTTVVVMINDLHTHLLSRPQWHAYHLCNMEGDEGEEKAVQPVSLCTGTNDEAAATAHGHDINDLFPASLWIWSRVA